MAEFHRRKIWDPVVRLWHWILVIVVTTGWCFGEFMSFATIRWHFYCGYAVLGLVAFRIIWGLVGPAPAKLRTWLPSPSAISSYLRGITKREPSGTPGHNPLGALSILAMMTMLTLQAASGLFIESDDLFDEGPLAHLVSGETSDRLHSLHGILATGILAIVALHLAAILFYLVWKKENLIKPMISGWKLVRSDE